MKKRASVLMICITTIVGCLFGVTWHAVGQAILIDNFDDGNDDGWTHRDMTVGEPWGPGNWDASDGSYRIESSDAVGFDEIGSLASTWDASLDPVFTHGHLRVKVRANSRSLAFINVRMQPVLDAEQADFYFIGGRADYGGFASWKAENQQMVHTQFLNAPWSFWPGRDWFFQLGAVGSQVSVKVWPVDEPEPEFPLRSYTDINASSYGGFGLGSYLPTGVSSDFVSATFDDVYFIPAYPGDYDGDASLTVDDIDMLSAELRVETPRFWYDLNEDRVTNQDDHTAWVKEFKNTWFGDADLDGEFNSSDMVQVFAAGKYETGEAAGWAEGDWNGDGVFDCSDMVAAFADGGYEKGRGQMRWRCRSQAGGCC